LLDCARAEFDHSTADILQMFKVRGQMPMSQGQRSRSQLNLKYQQLNSYKTATDGLSDFKVGMGVVMKSEKD